jgi:hypothetical protein
VEFRPEFAQGARSRLQARSLLIVVRAVPFHSNVPSAKVWSAEETTMIKHVKVALAAALVAGMAGCATWDDATQGRESTIGGAATGAVVGGAIAGPVGAVGGAVAGGAIGQEVGNEPNPSARH